MNVSKTTLAAVLIAACLAGYVLADRGNRPAGPADRPVLAALARLAKTGLWFLLVAEPPPEPAPPAALVHQPVGADGFPTINHAKGW